MAISNIGIISFLLAVMSIIIAVSFEIHHRRTRKKDQAKTAQSGEFNPQKASSSSYAMRAILAGNKVFVEKDAGGKLNIGLSDAVQVTIKDGRVYVSGEVVSLDGKIVAKIKDNEWYLDQGKNYFQRNYDDSALEVIGGDEGLVILQVEFIDKSTIRPAGLFKNKDGYLCVLYDRQYAIGDRNSMEKHSTETINSLRTLEPIFKYPSDRHLGERNPDRKLPELFSEEDQLKQTLQKRAGTYSKFGNDELIKKALDFVKRMREFALKERTNLIAIIKRKQPDTEEAKKEQGEERERYSTHLIKEYEGSYRIEAILLRNELLRRQPQIPSNYMGYHSYEYVNNALVIESVAADIDRLAKSLNAQK